MNAALQLLNGTHRGGPVAVLLCDGGVMCLSTDVRPSAID
jgi:hypothetical protein